ncbi:ATP-dependent DNA helicase PIF1-like protein, partial [Tanacetum coccineum]
MSAISSNRIHTYRYSVNSSNSQSRVQNSSFVTPWHRTTPTHLKDTSFPLSDITNYTNATSNKQPLSSVSSFSKQIRSNFIQNTNARKYSSSIRKVVGNTTETPIATKRVYKPRGKTRARNVNPYEITLTLKKCLTRVLLANAERWCPNHKLVLKVGTPIMLLRTIDPTNGLCNGTRLHVLKMEPTVIQTKIIGSTGPEGITLIPRMRLKPSDKRMQVKIIKKQFPNSVSFAMTINKSQ